MLASSGPGVLKTLMINAELFNGLELDMVPGNHAVDDGFALRMVEIAAQFWRPLPITDVYSNAALSHAATSFPELAVEFLLFLRASKPVAFVGNSNTSPALLRYLFGPQCQFIRGDLPASCCLSLSPFRQSVELTRGLLVPSAAEERICRPWRYPPGISRDAPRAVLAIICAGASVCTARYPKCYSSSYSW